MVLDLVQDLVYKTVMTRAVTIHEAKTHLSKLLVRVQAGEEIIIAKGDKPIAKISPLASEPADRKPGSAKDKIWMSDDFDAPLPPDLQAEFEK